MLMIRLLYFLLIETFQLFNLPYEKTLMPWVNGFL